MQQLNTSRTAGGAVVPLVLFSSGSGAVHESRQLITQTSHGGDGSGSGGTWQTAADSGGETAPPPPPTGARLLEEQRSAARPPEPADGPDHRSVRGGHVYPSHGVSVRHSGAQRQEAVCWSQCKSNVISVCYLRHLHPQYVVHFEAFHTFLMLLN